MAKDKPKKEDYVYCEKCKCYIHKDCIEKGFWDSDECPVCEADLKLPEKGGKD